MTTNQVIDVTISNEEYLQLKQFEDWVSYYIQKNGLPCHDFRNKFPDFKVWYDENKNKAKRIEQQKKLDAKVALLLPLLEGLPNPYEAGKAIVLAMAAGSTYSELLPKPTTPVPVVSSNCGEYEEEDDI